MESNKIIIKQNGGSREETLKIYGEEIENCQQLFEKINSQLKFKVGSKSKVYSQQGIQLFDDDMTYLRNGETLYYDYKGKEFDSTQIIDQYHKEQLLGEGGFGKVYKGRHKETGELVAIKYISLAEYLKSANQIEEIYREAKILKMLKHKNIINLHQAFILKNDVVLIMEYADGGELVEYVEQTKGLNEIETRKIIKQLISALDCCHEQGVIHRDLKLENVLFESKAKSRIKVVDFGISGMCKGNIHEKNDAGTLRYMAPEVLQSAYTTANPAIDIWAMGVMMYCMVFDKFPFNGETSAIIKEKIINGNYRIPRGTPVTEEFIDLLSKLLNKDPTERYTLNQIRNHKWLLLSDNAIQLKVDLAKQAIERKQKQEEEEKLTIPIKISGGGRQESRSPVRNQGGGSASNVLHGYRKDLKSSQGDRKVVIQKPSQLLQLPNSGSKAGARKSFLTPSTGGSFIAKKGAKLNEGDDQKKETSASRINKSNDRADWLLKQ